MKKVIWTVVVLAIISGGIYFLNYFSLTQPTLNELKTDSRNTGIEINLHYKNFILTNTLVFNLKDVEEDKAVADVFRVLLQTSFALKEQKFESVELAFKGKSKFKLSGDYFKKLGDEYKIQNPIYTMRTFPEHVTDLEGQSVYSVWTGGMLGVLNKQMEDFNDFNNQWYLNELSSKY